MTGQSVKEIMAQALWKVWSEKKTEGAQPKHHHPRVTVGMPKAVAPLRSDIRSFTLPRVGCQVGTDFT